MFSIIWIFIRVIAYLAAVPSKHLQYILILQDIRSNVGWVFIELLLVAFLYVGIVPSESMYPTLHIGDASIVVRLHCLVGLKRNNIVIFKLGGDISDNTQEILVKRIVALSLDRVSVRDGNLYVNGVIQEEVFINEAMEYELKEFVVPAGHVFVLGDNRNHSFDGSWWGCLPIDNVIGKVVYSVRSKIFTSIIEVVSTFYVLFSMLISY